MLRRSIVLLLALGLPAVPSADIVPLGGERVVATAVDPEHYFYPPDSAARGSEFVVTWTSAFARYSGSNLFDWGSGVHGRRVTADGRPVGDLLTPVPVADKIDIGVSTVAADAAGRYVVAWNSASEHHRHLFLWLRQFPPAGRALSTVRLDRLETGFLDVPAGVALGASGRALAVWGQPRPSASSFVSLGLFGQLFRPTGQPLTPRFGITTRLVVPSLPALGIDALGNAVQVYTVIDGPGHSSVHLRRYDRDGQPQTDEVRLAPAAFAAALSVRADGRFVVVWGTTHNRLQARIFAPPFRPLGPAIEVTSGLTASPSWADVALGPDGHFLVTWAEDVPESNQQRILARGFGPRGEPLGEPFYVDSGPPALYGFVDGGGPTVSVSQSGTFLVAWTRVSADTGREQILSRLYGVAAP